ncbi:MAG: HIT family protein [Blastocatellia bacterium]|nr:HIT family protein [Blastocatellia bacterium]
MTECLFCTPRDERVFLRNELAYALWDGFPVTPLHSLIIPRRHATDYFDLTRDELLACDDLLREAKSAVCTQDSSIGGFNIGLNVGSVAGQTVFHCHIHLMPRRRGDVDNPRGGVRNTIPGKGDY